MNGSNKRIFGVALVTFLAGSAVGWALAAQEKTAAAPVPERWVARIDDFYISDAAFMEEMQRRGGDQPGQFQDVEQRRQLLDDLVYRATLVKAAEQKGLLEQPELRRTLDQVVSNRYLQDTLRQVQREVQVSDEEVKRYYQEHAEEYTVPARKRVAMLKISVAKDAGEPVWRDAEVRMAKAREEASALDLSVPHFGNLARTVSDDAASRYRGGVIGWISEGRSDRYSYAREVLESVRQLEQPGSLSNVIRADDGVYLVRLVESEPRQQRGLDQLSSGIRQHLLQIRLAEAEKSFRQRLMRDVGVEVRESVLASIAPLSSPEAEKRLQPPPMPSDQG